MTTISTLILFTIGLLAVPGSFGSLVLQTSLPTVTVRGFLNFRTTVDGTVIVFTPSPSASQSTRVPQPPIPEIKTTAPPSLPKIEPTKASAFPQQTYPTGLVTVLGGTVVNAGKTTEYETKVIGTYISGKYAQILSSTVKVRDPELTSPTIRPTAALGRPQVRETQRPFPHPRAPLSSSHKPYSVPTTNSPVRPTSTTPRPRFVYHEEPSTTTTTTTEKPVPKFHKPITPLHSKTQKLFENSKNRARFALNPLKTRWAKKDPEAEINPNEERVDPHESRAMAKIRKAKQLAARRFAQTPRNPKIKMNRFKSKLPPTQAEEMKEYQAKNPEITVPAPEVTTEKSKIDQKSKDKIIEHLASTTEAPEANITKPEIDPSKVVKEVATITSEVTQHVEGDHIQVKTLTLTTTLERTLHPSETHFDTNIVKPTIDLAANDLEATVIPETPALVMTRTYSVTERTMRTTVVPVFDGTQTQSHTVTESFFIRKLITAYRTLPPGDVMLIDSTATSQPPQTLNTELINGTAILNDDLSMAEQGLQPSSVENSIAPTDMIAMQTMAPGMPMMPPQGGLEPSMAAPQQGFNQQFDLNNPLLLAAMLQNPQLAAFYIGLQQLQKPQAPSTVTKPTHIIQTETVFHTKYIKYYDGLQTRTKTIVEPTGTTEKTIQTVTTEVIQPSMPQLPLQFSQFMPQNFNNAFQQTPQASPSSPSQQQQQQQFQNMLNLIGQNGGQNGGSAPFQFTPALSTSHVLKTVTTVQDVTSTRSKVYTLVYNAFSTRHRTITSTTVVPETVTTVLTETVTVTPTATLMPSMQMFG